MGLRPTQVFLYPLCARNSFSLFLILLDCNNGEQDVTGASLHQLTRGGRVRHQSDDLTDVMS